MVKLGSLFDGNEIALPCALHVMQGVARVMEEEDA